MIVRLISDLYILSAGLGFAIILFVLGIKYQELKKILESDSREPKFPLE